MSPVSKLSNSGRLYSQINLQRLPLSKPPSVAGSEGQDFGVRAVSDCWQGRLSLPHHQILLSHLLSERLPVWPLRVQPGPFKSCRDLTSERTQPRFEQPAVATGTLGRKALCTLRAVCIFPGEAALLLAAVLFLYPPRPSVLASCLITLQLIAALYCPLSK